MGAADGNCGFAACGLKWVWAGPTLLLNPEYSLRFLHHIGEGAVSEWGYQPGRPDQFLEWCEPPWAHSATKASIVPA